MKWLSVGMAALAATAGCGSDEIKLVPVTGTVISEGKPLAGARVTFMPEPGNKPETPGSAATDPAGKYIIRWNERAGVAPGNYHVVITPAFVLPPNVKVPPEFKNDPLMFELSLGQPRTGSKAAPTLKGEFSANVTDAGGSHDFDLKPSATTKPGPGR